MKYAVTCNKEVIAQFRWETDAIKFIKLQVSGYLLCSGWKIENCPDDIINSKSVCHSICWELKKIGKD